MNTSEEYNKVIIVHPTVHLFFSVVYVMFLNIASYLAAVCVFGPIGEKQDGRPCV